MKEEICLSKFLVNLSLRPKLLVLSRAVSNSTLEDLLRSRPKTPTVTGYLFQNPDTYTIHPKV